MASEKITALVEEVKTLTVLELSELVHSGGSFRCFRRCRCCCRSRRCRCC